MTHNSFFDVITRELDVIILFSLSHFQRDDVAAKSDLYIDIDRF